MLLNIPDYFDRMSTLAKQYTNIMVAEADKDSSWCTSRPSPLKKRRITVGLNWPISKQHVSLAEKSGIFYDVHMNAIDTRGIPIMFDENCMVKYCEPHGQVQSLVYANALRPTAYCY